VAAAIRVSVDKPSISGTSLASRGLVPDRLALLRMPLVLFSHSSSVRPLALGLAGWWWPATAFASGCKRRRCGWVCPRSAPFVMRRRKTSPREIKAIDVLEGISLFQKAWALTN